MKRTLGILALGALSLSLAACGGGSSVNTTPVSTGNGTTYQQIELLSRPAVKELFETFVNHQVTNAAEPYSDTTLQTSISAFTDALRPPNTTVGSDYGKALAGILYPNEMVADISQSGNASYLGVETGGATGGKFGGRGLADDVIDISLGAVFGNTLGALKVQPEDNEENNCLSKDNVTQRASQAPTTTFPYLATPH